VLLAITIPARQRTASRAVLTSNESPMLRFEHALIPWNRYLIMPVFALANAGVALGVGAAQSVVAPVSLA